VKCRVFFAALFFWGLSAGSASAQGILPSSFAGWNAAAPAAQASASHLEQFSGDRAAILREYGVDAAERRDFERGSQAATVTLYRMVDPSAAFGAFTFLKNPEMAPLAQSGSAAYAAGEHDKAILVIGNLLLEVSSPQDRPGDPDLAQLAIAVTPRADARPFPRIIDFLPTEGRVTGSERYVLGPKAMAQVFPAGPHGETDWVGFDRSAEAMVARYHLKSAPKDQEMVLLLATYPTQQIAADQYGALNKWFALNVDAAAANGRPIVYGTRMSSMVAMVAGAPSRDTAASMLGQIRYFTQVTWNEPSQNFSDPSISTIVVGAITYTGLIMMIALAAGLGFGGFRIFMKFLLPGRVFDRSRDVEILQLGLASKPVEVKDFYQ
jgi:hypothetical protein